MTETRASTLTVQMAESLLAKAGPSVSVAEVVERTGGHISTVYEVECTEPAQRLIIKVYGDQWRWKQEKELYVYRLLAGHLAGHCRRHAATRALSRGRLAMNCGDGSPRPPGPSREVRAGTDSYRVGGIRQTETCEVLRADRGRRPHGVGAAVHDNLSVGPRVEDGISN